jgi:hypothetical protein
MAQSLMQYKLKTGVHLECKHWYLQQNMDGYNLFQLKHLQIINTVAVYLNYSANTKDKYANGAMAANFNQSFIIAKTQRRLSKLKLEIVINPAVINENYILSPNHYIFLPALRKKISLAGVTNIKKLITDNNRLISLVHTQEIIKIPHTNKTVRKTLVKDLCEDNSVNEILPHVLVNTNSKAYIVDTNQCFFDTDPEFNAYEVFVDETTKLSGECAYGIYYSANNDYNIGLKTYNSNSLQSSTFQAIEWVLKTFPIDQNINIYIDRELALKMLLKLSLTSREKHHTQKLHHLNYIYEMQKNRTGTT